MVKTIDAHPMPHTVVLLDVRANTIDATLSWPLNELQVVMPDEDIMRNPLTLAARRPANMKAYLLSHIALTDSLGQPWMITVTGMHVTTAEQPMTGLFYELVFDLHMVPPAGASPRHFVLQYDAIMHQLVTHKALISIRHDWDGGMSERDSTNAEIGMLSVNPADNKVHPLVVSLDDGGYWRGLKNMFSLGMIHIREGTDHLLFLVVLMLVAPLTASGGRWYGGNGTRRSLIRLFTMITAFTIGHSLTLAAGALSWLRLPTQPIEVLIAVSILVGAVHALRPVFPGRESYIAGGFGLIHGLAFATAINGLDLDATRMTLSILGFNLGIEFMQFAIILLVIPWLLILSRYRVYDYVRIIGACFALVASLAWVAERVTMKINPVSSIVQIILLHGLWIILLLALMAVSSLLVRSDTE